MEIHALNQFCIGVIVKYDTKFSFVNIWHDGQAEFTSLSRLKNNHLLSQSRAYKPIMRYFVSPICVTSLATKT
jgi:hypothetical protein